MIRNHLAWKFSQLCVNLENGRKGRLKVQTACFTCCSVELTMFEMLIASACVLGMPSTQTAALSSARLHELSHMVQFRLEGGHRRQSSHLL